MCAGSFRRFATHSVVFGLLNLLHHRLPGSSTLLLLFMLHIHLFTKCLSLRLIVCVKCCAAHFVSRWKCPRRRRHQTFCFSRCCFPCRNTVVSLVSQTPHMRWRFQVTFKTSGRLKRWPPNSLLQFLEQSGEPAAELVDIRSMCNQQSLRGHRAVFCGRGGRSRAAGSAVCCCQVDASVRR